MTISMRSFIASGQLGPIQLGASRSEAEAAFGPPSDGFSEVDPAGLAVWIYGGVELQWRGQRLWRIFCDEFDSPCAWIDLWILHSALSPAWAEAELQASGIDYSRGEVPDLSGDIYLAAASGVCLRFTPSSSGVLELNSCFLNS